MRAGCTIIKSRFERDHEATQRSAERVDLRRSLSGRGSSPTPLWKLWQETLCTYPEIVGELQGEDGDALIVKGASNGAGNIAGDDGDEAGRQQPCALVPQLAGQQEGGDGGETAEHGCQKDAHVPDVDRDVQEVQNVVDEAGGDHQAWIYLYRGAQRQSFNKEANMKSRLEGK